MLLVKCVIQTTSRSFVAEMCPSLNTILLNIFWSWKWWQHSGWWWSIAPWLGHFIQLFSVYVPTSNINMQAKFSIRTYTEMYSLKIKNKNRGLIEVYYTKLLISIVKITWFQSLKKHISNFKNVENIKFSIKPYI